MTQQLIAAQEIWKAAIHWDKDTGPAFPSIRELRDSLDIMLASRPDDPRGVDSLDMAAPVFDGATGGSLLSVLLWHTGLGQIPVSNAVSMVQMLLRRSADPNRIENGYRPLDMLFSGLHNAMLDEPVDFTPVFEILVRFGMDPQVPGKYSIEEIESKLRKDGVDPSLLHILIEGSRAVRLDRETPCVQRSACRRSL